MSTHQEQSRKSNGIVLQAGLDVLGRFMWLLLGGWESGGLSAQVTWPGSNFLRRNDGLFICVISCGDPIAKSLAMINRANQLMIRSPYTGVSRQFIWCAQESVHKL